MTHDKPNIVWIYSDELRTDALNCYGDAGMQVRTPHVDALAAGGVRFSNCFCNSPIRVSSRASILTGLYPEDTGVYCNEGAWPSYRMDRVFLTSPEVFAEHGYATINFGKVHVPREIRQWQHSDPAGSGMGELAQDVPGAPRSNLGPPSCSGSFPAGKPYPPERVTENGLRWRAAAGRGGRASAPLGRELKHLLNCAIEVDSSQPVVNEEPAAVVRPYGETPVGVAHVELHTAGERVAGNRLLEEDFLAVQVQAIEQRLVNLRSLVILAVELDQAHHRPRPRRKDITGRSRADGRLERLDDLLPLGVQQHEGGAFILTQLAGA